MTISFHAPSPWIEIGKRAHAKRRAYVAVPYIGVNAYQQLPLAPGSKLVTCLSEDAVKSGTVDPREVKKYLRAGVDVYDYPDLHAKVYVLGNTAFIGSANLSRRSAGLVEACIRTTEAVVVADAKSFVRSLCTNPLTPTTVDRMIPLYRPPLSGRQTTGAAPANRNDRTTPRFWVSPVHHAAWEAEETAAKRRAWPRAIKQLANADRFLLEPVCVDQPIRFELDDLVTLRWSYGRGFRFQHPSKVVWIEPVPETDSAIIFLERPKYRREVLSSRVRKELNGHAEQFIRSGDADRRVKPVAIGAFLQLWDR